MINWEQNEIKVSCFQLLFQKLWHYVQNNILHSLLIAQPTRRDYYETVRHLSPSNWNDGEIFEDVVRKIKVNIVIEVCNKKNCMVDIFFQKVEISYQAQMEAIITHSWKICDGELHLVSCRIRFEWIQLLL